MIPDCKWRGQCAGVLCSSLHKNELYDRTIKVLFYELIDADIDY